MGQSNRAIASLFCQGSWPVREPRGNFLKSSTIESTIDRLWNPIIAEWYEGKDDPKLALVRFDVEDGKESGSATCKGFLKPAFNKLLGRKPEAGMKEKVAEVRLQ